MLKKGNIYLVGEIWWNHLYFTHTNFILFKSVRFIISFILYINDKLFLYSSLHYVFKPCEFKIYTYLIVCKHHFCAGVSLNIYSFIFSLTLSLAHIQTLSSFLFLSYAFSISSSSSSSSSLSLSLSLSFSLSLSLCVCVRVPSVSPHLFFFFPLYSFSVNLSSNYELQDAICSISHISLLHQFQRSLHIAGRTRKQINTS